jgi:hypothetical protein
MSADLILLAFFLPVMWFIASLFYGADERESHEEVSQRQALGLKSDGPV